MANRDALRDLQSRLAARLQTARAEGVSLSWLAVEAGGVGYLLPLHQSGEIFPWDSAQKVPYTQPWFLGVANLRGGLYGVVELARFVAGLTQPDQRPAVQTSARPEYYLVALNAALDVNCVLLVDRLLGLRSVESFAKSDGAPTGTPAFFGNVYAEASGALWQELDLQLLARQPHFLSVSA